MTRLKDTAIREQIFNFLSLSSDIGRNQHDSEFSDSGGQILYCFDSTIFNLFFNTVRWRHAVSSFYGRDWTNTRQATSDGPTGQWKRIEAQSALIASEHLLSEDLPGSKNRNIYLTPWHRTELARRLQEVVQDYDQGEVDAEKVEEEIKSKLDFLVLSRQMSEDNQRSVFQSDDILERDLQDLSGFIHQPASLIRYELTRRAATMLVRCEVSERLDQIHRLVSRPLRHRIKSLHPLFRPAEDEIKAIKVDARKWYLRILGEVERDAGERPTPRKPGGIWNDARSIAYVRWAATKTRNDQRLVLVTSDDRIFDAYRRWWSDAGITQDGEPEQFVLRRSFQYTPIFNLRDSKNDLSRTESMHGDIAKLFQQINEAVQLTLLPFNLAQIDKDKKLGSLAHNRHFEYMALRAKDFREGESDPVMDFFMERLDGAWYEEQSSQIKDIAALWRNIERIGIGFFYDQVVKRLEDDQYLFGMDGGVEPGPQTTAEALKYFSSAIKAITDRTRSTYLPIAESFLKRQLDAEGGSSTRAPDLLWYQLPNRKSVYEMIKTWPKKKDRERAFSISEFNRVAEAPFVLATAFALARQDWWKAEEFADYALSACRAHEPGPQVLSEMLFMNAFAKRFRLGSSTVFESVQAALVREDAALASLRRAIELFEAAGELLEEYLDLAGRRPLQHEKILFGLRGKSERAALRLFMALRCHFTAVEGSEFAPFAPDQLVRDAQADIRDCMKLDRTLPRELRAKQAAVRSQFRHNAAASEVVRFIIQGNAFAPEPAFSKLAGNLADQEYRKIEEEQPLVRSERIAFEILHGCADPLEWAELEDALTNATQTGLTIDRMFARAILGRKNDLFERLGD